MIHPDDVEDGELEFEPFEEDGQDIYDRIQEDRWANEQYINTPDSRGFAPADFINDPIGKDRA